VALQILLTNDDGIDAPGIAVLRCALEGLGEVTTIAPDHDTSAVARSITVRRALRLTPRTFGGGFAGLACDGTPSDCVRVALLGLRCPAPDIVVSGVNAGGNMGADLTYSGTVGAAFEAALRGRPGVAFSVEALEPGWLTEAVPVMRAIVRLVVERGLPRHTSLNVNLPDRPLAEITGVRPARLGGSSAYDYVLLAGDDGAPDGKHYLPGEPPASGDRLDLDTDFDVVASGAVAVTPLSYDLLDPDPLTDLAGWDLDLESLRERHE
jgi:5'-nucleotidase